MKILNKTLILFSVCFICNIISNYLPFPFPGSVLSMIAIFIMLFFGLLKTNHLEPVSSFLLNNMALIFVPATVSIVSYFDTFKSVLWQFIVICTTTTIITFLATAYSVKLTIYIMKKIKERRHA